MKSVDWEYELYEKFVNHGEFVYNKGGHPATVGEIKDFIRKLLSEQKKEFVEMIGEDEPTYLDVEKDTILGEEANELRAELRKKLQVKIIEE